mmetsp:Transcript_17468/g.25987  ORF Transcript_17468/g.25987 Transcript_17468/m.25987 type:complete len:301 (+) Transcript_17468:1-903(+)
MTSKNDQEDLAQYHYPITDSSKKTNGKPLTNEQITFFQEHGYLSNIQLLEESEVDALLDELEKNLIAEKAPSPYFYEYHANELDQVNSTQESVLFHALGAWRVSKLFHDLVFHQRLAKIVSQLLNNAKKVRLFHDQIFAKPPRYGATVAWHQDYSYWTRTKPMNHLTVHIALDAQDEQNGCLHYVDGSHQWNLLPVTSRHFNDMESILKVLNPQQIDHFRRHTKSIIYKRGQISIHHPLLVHGSFGNTSDRPRRAYVLNFLGDTVRSDTNEPLLEGVPVIKKGEIVKGKYFPIVYPFPKS